MSYEPTTKTQELLHSELLRFMGDMTVHREHRMEAVNAAIPGVLWYMVVIGALLTIVFLWMIHMQLIPQIVLGGATAFFLGIMIFLIYAMDHPLQGAVSVQPDSFRSVYDSVMKWDEAA